MTTWSCGDLPESVVVEEVGGAPLLAYPGLAVRETEVDVRLFRHREEAERASGPGVRRLAELLLARDLSRLGKELAGLARHLPAGPPKPAVHFPPALQQMSANTWICSGDLESDKAVSLRAKLVVLGSFSAGPGSELFEDLKVTGNLSIGSGSVCHGALVSGAAVTLGAGCRFERVLHAAGDLRLGPNVRGEGPQAGGIGSI